MTSLYSTIRNALAGLALAAASVGGAQAATVDVTVGADVFTIGTITGTFADNRTLLESQPWWDDLGLAAALRDGIGFDSVLANDGDGPFFAWTASPTNVFAAAFIEVSGSGTGFFSTTFGVDATRNYAIAESVAPIPLPPAAFLLLGGLGALGLVKRRRG